MADKTKADQLTEREARERMDAALKGARIVGPMPMAKMTPKRPKPQRKAATKPAAPKK